MKELQRHTINSYGKVWHLGHRNVRDLFEYPCIVEEKVDGSQFTFAMLDGKLCARSRNMEIDLKNDNIPNLFRPTVEHIRSVAHLLRPDWVYRGEAMKAAKHNALEYGRPPAGNLVLFDVETTPSYFLEHEEKAEEAERLGLEPVPLVCRVEPGIDQPSKDWLEGLMERESVLGGVKIEGVVFKAVGGFGGDGKSLKAKFVSDAFKEVHRKDWKKQHPTKKDILAEVLKKYRTEARYQKCVQHLEERGELSGDYTDIGPLIKEMQGDVLEECLEEIKEDFWQYFAPNFKRRIGNAIPQWYKDKLLAEQFPEEQEEKADDNAG